MGVRRGIPDGPPCGLARAARGLVAGGARRRELACWAGLAAALIVPAAIGPNGMVLTYCSRTAALIVLALSYNLLLGTTGLLSFCHAGFGAVFGLVATRRAGTAFAMITLGLGELIAAAAWSLPAGFGGAGGLAIDRTAAAPFGAWHFASDREAYTLIVVWCLLSALAMRALVATPFARLARAVRDDARRVAALGTDARRIRYAMMVIAAGFAGIAGALSLIDIEVASADSVGMLRSSTVLFATVIGGSASFFGPVLGAAVLTAFSTFVACVSHAWPFYLGLLFVAVVVGSPGGLAAGCLAQGRQWRAGSWRARVRQGLRLKAGFAMAAAIVLAVELGYALQLGDAAGDVGDARGNVRHLAALGAWQLDAASLRGWWPVVALATVAAGLRALAAIGATSDADRGEPGRQGVPGGQGDPVRPAELAGQRPTHAPGGTNAIRVPGGPSVMSTPASAPTDERRPPGPAALELRGVAKRFGATQVLLGVDLRVEAGERHVLIGPNGAGKSTLFDLIAGATRPTRGTIHLHGRSIGGHASHRIARLGVARGFQQTRVFERMSVRENLRCAAMHDESARHGGHRWLRAWRDSAVLDARAREVLDAIGLSSRADMLAGRLDYAQQRALDLGLSSYA